MDHRDRATPVALPRDQPIAQPEGDLGRANTALFGGLDDGGLGLLSLQPIKFSGAHQLAQTGERFAGFAGVGNVAWLNDNGGDR